MSEEKTADVAAGKKEAKKQANTPPKIQWNDSKMATTYANAVNASSTREEVSIFFGTNQTWNLNQSDTLNIELTDRIILNPYAAKRLAVLLSGVVGEYEKRFGELPL
ncbi:MAG: DUF3467 domain-containing protein [Gammaproteobacteria bacterium]|nr:DUF3467 domain-containing protein [Gammaproteobacteria bacterium]